MSHYQPLDRRVVTVPFVLLGILGAIGLFYLGQRFIYGMGSVTNLTGGFPCSMCRQMGLRNLIQVLTEPRNAITKQKIREFDLIVFDRYEHRGILQLLYYDNIARYVEEHGGALLVAAGEAYAGQQSIVRTPLFPVLPAMPTGEIMD